MIWLLKTNFESKSKKTLIENFMSLSVLQGASYLLPLVTLPYLVRVLGAERFGLVVFAQVFTEYFVMLTDYGFNLSATQQIAVNKNDDQKLSEIFTCVIAIKTFFMIVGFGVMALIVFSFSKLQDNWLLYFFSYGTVLGQTYFPIWFFQGMEKMKYITILNITAKLVFTLLMFIVIRDPDDYIFVPLINSLGYILAGGLSLWFIYRNFSIKISLRALMDGKLIFQLKEGFFVFLSVTSSTLLYRSSVIFIGLFLGYTTVTYYSVAEKIMNVFKGIIMIINQTVFPVLSRLAKENKKQYFTSWKKVATLNMLCAGLSFIFLMLFSDRIISTLFSDEMSPSIWMLRYLSISVIFYFAITMLGLLGMLILGHTKELSYSQIVPSIVYIVASPFILKFLPFHYYLILFLLLEFSIIVYRYIFLKKIAFFEATK